MKNKSKERFQGDPELYEMVELKKKKEEEPKKDAK
jgi:hypothetical protein